MIPANRQRTSRERDLVVISCDALTLAARAEIIQLCEAAYREDFSHLFEHLPASVHVLARDECGVLISHAEFVPRWLEAAGSGMMRTAYVEAVATAPGHQRQG